MNKLKRITFCALTLLGAASFMQADGPDDECVICTEQCFDANYNLVRPVVVLHRPQNVQTRPHTICRACYDNLRERDDRCPECREEMDVAFINNASQQNQVLAQRRLYLQAQKIQQRPPPSAPARPQPSAPAVNQRQERERIREQQEQQRRQAEQIARQRAADRQQAEENRQRERRFQEEEINRERERARRQEEQRQQSERVAQEQEPIRRQAQQIHANIRYASLMLCFVPGLCRWYIGQLARII